MFLIIAAQGAAPSPVYPLYAAKWHLSPFVTTLIFAAYVVGMVLTLTTAGSLSDHLGRRPLIVVSALFAVGSLVLFAVSGGAWEVILARFLQGIALALAVTTLGAVLLDRAPKKRPHLAHTLNGATPPAGLAVGALTSSVLVQYVPSPTVIVFVVYAAVTAVIAVLVCVSPQQSIRRPGALASLRPSVGVPPQSRAAFITVLGCLLAAWSLGGLYLGLGPSVVRGLFGLHNALAGGAAIAAVTGTGAATGFALRLTSPARTMSIGAVALVLGPAVTIIAVLADSTWLFYVSSVIGGVGFGAGFQGGLRYVLATAPEHGRAGLLSSIYIASYSAFAGPTLVAGLLTPSLGLKTVMVGFGVFVGLLSSCALLAQRLITPNSLSTATER